MKELYYNGEILTMEREETAEAVLVEDGRIAAVGEREKLERMAPEAVKRDLNGHTLMPAFIDPHSHFTAAAAGLLQAPLEEAASFSELEEKIKAFIADNGVEAGKWVTGDGYDHNMLAEGTHPDRELLDRAAPNNPVVIKHKSGHVGVFNTMALEKLGITEQTQAPEGGVIGKKDGRLTGYMEEAAFVGNVRKTPLPDLQDFMQALIKVQEKYASYGITTVQEGMMVEELIPIYRELLDSGQLKLDVVGYADLAASDGIKVAFPASVKGYDRHFRLGGYKIFLDGSPQGRTAWMLTPYVAEKGREEYYGYPTMKDEDVRAALKRASEEGVQLLAHCNGDAASAQYIACAKAVMEEGFSLEECRPVIVHAQFLNRRQLPEVKACHMIPSFFIAHVYYWGDVHLKNFGERAELISPAASAQKAGIRFTFHQDTPVVEPDMLRTVWCAVCRRTKAGKLLGGEERISARAALEAVTVNAAFQYGEEAKKGSIRAGKLADLVILDKNPLKTPVEELFDIQVLQTVKEGRTIYSKGAVS